MNYIFDEAVLRKSLRQRGFASLSEFAEKAGMHRNTLNQYLIEKRSVFTRAVLTVSEKLGVDPLELIKRAPAHHTDPEERLAAALELLAVRFPRVTFLLLGSRARGEAKKFSDFDVGVTGGASSLQDNEYLKLKVEFEDVLDDFEYHVDLVNLDVAPPWFLEKISYETRLLAGREQNRIYFQGLLDGLKKAQTTA